MPSKIVNIRFDEATLMRADAMVESGLYASRSSFIRSATMERLVRDEQFVEPMKKLLTLLGNFDNWYAPPNKRSDDEVHEMVDTIEDLKKMFTGKAALMTKIITAERAALLYPSTKSCPGIMSDRDQDEQPDSVEEILSSLASLADASTFQTPLLRTFLDGLA